MKNHYEILGLTESATQEKIRGAFKKLAVRFHPDKHQGDRQMEERFKEINESYQVLSDPRRKASYDLKWNYQRFNKAYTSEESGRRYYRPQAENRESRRYQTPDVENRKATLYAFVFTFLIAVLVTAVIYGRKQYFKNQFDHLLQARQARFEQAANYYAKGQLNETLEVIDELQPYFPEEKYLSVFEQNIMQDMEAEANFLYNNRQYQEAIKYMEVLIKHASYPDYDIQTRMALAYQKIGDHDMAIALLTELIEQDFDIIGSILLIAEIYRTDMKNDSLALVYYQLAREAVTSQYIAVYGDAYPLTINAYRVPIAHYKLYTQLTRLFARAGQIEEALQANRWARRVWPDSSRLHEQAGYLRAQQGLYVQACDHYRTARNKGALGAFPDYCK